MRLQARVSVVDGWWCPAFLAFTLFIMTRYILLTYGYIKYIYGYITVQKNFLAGFLFSTRGELTDHFPNHSGRMAFLNLSSNFPTLEGNLEV